MPTYVIDQYPELATWDGFKAPANVRLFETAENTTQGQFLGGDPSWTQYDAQIIQNLGLDLTVVMSGSESATLSALEAAYPRQQPLLFYFWLPHWAHVKYDLTNVALPPYSDTCWARAASGGIDCDYPTDYLFKIVWPGLADANRPGIPPAPALRVHDQGPVGDGSVPWASRGRRSIRPRATG